MDFIAEVGWNHMGDMCLANEMIVAAKNAGATHVKFQFWQPSKLKPGPWDGDGRREIYLKAALTPEKISRLVEVCEDNEVQFLISAFNKADSQMLFESGIRKIKVPSHCAHDVGMHRFVSQNFDYVYVSLGACTGDELARSTSIYSERSRGSWVAMHCVSSYPCLPEKANLRRINDLKRLSPTVGYSDHTVGVNAAIAATVLGAVCIEKHFTTDKTLPGRDNTFAAEPDEFRKMVQGCLEVEDICTYHGIDAQDCELDVINQYRGRWGEE